MTQIDVDDIRIIPDTREGLFIVRIDVGSFMYFDSPPLPKEAAEGTKQNLINKTEPKSDIYG